MEVAIQMDRIWAYSLLRFYPSIASTLRGTCTMSQANPKYSEYEIAPERERQSPAPITNGLPVHVLTDEVDPTQEIRTLINELQTAARDSRLQLMGVEHQRDGAVRQLNEILRESDRRTQEFAAKFAEVQKQVLAIRQARDASQAQNLAITSKLLKVDDEIVDLGYARDAALKTAEVSSEKITSFCEQLDVVTRDRDVAIKQADDLRSGLEEERRKVVDLEGQRSGLVQTNHEQATALMEARAEVLALTEKHDDDLSRAQELAHGEAAELESTRRELAAASADRDSKIQRSRELLAETVSLQEQLAAVTDQLAAAQREREDALENAERYEERRLQFIDLASQLEATRRELSKTSADLGEARLQLKLAQTVRVL
jgi:DNA repair exonuclease SbcCD ATPase subunit